MSQSKGVFSCTYYSPLTDFLQLFAEYLSFWYIYKINHEDITKSDFLMAIIEDTVDEQLQFACANI